MKLALILGIGLGVALSGLAADQGAITNSPKGKMSYAIGLEMGKNITNYMVELDPDALAAGIRDVVSGKKSLLTEQEAMEAVNEFRNQIQAKRGEQQKMMQEKNKEAGMKNKKEGDAFLAENKKKEGWKTTSSGLQYKILTQGKGKIPTSNDTVTSRQRRNQWGRQGSRES